MSVTEQTPKDVFLSLNGFDELAITKHFGTDISVLRRSPLSMVRAMVFIHHKRERRSNAPAAYDYAMSMPVGELQDYFAAEPEEVFEDEPDTELGKDDSHSTG